LYSNDISKIWNNDVFVTGTDEEKQSAIDAVKLLCIENNFCIDYAKTLYKPKCPECKNTLITKYTHSKLPTFFEYAKDKEVHQVSKRNGSFVNKIYKRIPNKSINTKSLDLGTIDYRLMMNNVNNTCSNEVAELYNNLNKQYRYMVNMKEEYIDNSHYVACEIRVIFNTTGYSEETITDMLVDYLYGNEKRYKQLLWFCYGQYIVDNLEKNIQIKNTKLVECTDCGEWFEVGMKDNKSCRCKNFQLNEKRRIDREYRRKQRMSI
jgi:hypothetical protein